MYIYTNVCNVRNVCPRELSKCVFVSSAYSIGRRSQPCSQTPCPPEGEGPIHMAEQGAPQVGADTPTKC